MRCELSDLPSRSTIQDKVHQSQLPSERRLANQRQGPRLQACFCACSSNPLLSKNTSLERATRHVCLWKGEGCVDRGQDKHHPDNKLWRVFSMDRRLRAWLCQHLPRVHEREAGALTRSGLVPPLSKESVWASVSNLHKAPSTPHTHKSSLTFSSCYTYIAPMFLHCFLRLL